MLSVVNMLRHPALPPPPLIKTRISNSYGKRMAGGNNIYPWSFKDMDSLGHTLNYENYDV